MQAGGANVRWDVRWFERVDSTNRVAAALAVDGLVVVADHQTEGRGRFDRRWEAPPGSSLLVSIVLSSAPPLAPLAVALAAAEACEEVAGVGVRLKWPNDLMADDRKLGGILGRWGEAAAVIGLGLNVNWGAVDPPADGTSLDRVAGGTVDRLSLLAALLGRLDPSRPDLLARYRERSATLGRVVRVDLGREVVEGPAVDVTPGGHLVVGDRVIASGDVVHCRVAPEGP